VMYYRMVSYSTILSHSNHSRISTSPALSEDARLSNRIPPAISCSSRRRNGTRTSPDKAGKGRRNV
jgi:hypothetical protein